MTRVKAMNYRANYNKEHDILDVLTEKVRKSYVVERGKRGISYYLMKDQETNRIVGVEILDFSRVERGLLKTALPRLFSQFDFSTVS